MRPQAGVCPRAQHACLEIRNGKYFLALKKGCVAIIFTFSLENECIAILKIDLNSLHEDNNIDNKKFSERFNKY